jgi:hypothetical protein
MVIVTRSYKNTLVLILLSIILLGVRGASAERSDSP